MVVERKTVQVYEWHDRKGQKHLFSIDLALNLIEFRGNATPDYQMSYQEARAAAVRNKLIETFDMEYAMTTDLTKPVIVAMVQDMDVDGQAAGLLIDGWHRIIKFLLKGKKTASLPAYILTVEETNKCRVKVQ